MTTEDDAKRVNRQIFDNLSAGEQAQLLAQLVTSSQPTTATLAASSMVDLLARDFPPLTWLVDDLVARGYLVMLGGRPKSGKSWLGLQLAMAVDQGVDFLDRPTRTGKTLYIALEDGERRMQQRVNLLKWQPRAADVATTIARFVGDNGEPGPGLLQLREAASVGNYDLIVVDTLIATLSGRANENDNAQMGELLNDLARIAHDTDTAIVVIHHTGKQGADDIFGTLRGASAIRGAYDLGLILERKQAEREAVLHIEARDFDASSLTLQQVVGGAGWECMGDGKAIGYLRAGRTAVEMLKEHGEGLTAQELSDLSGKTADAVRKCMATAEKHYRVKVVVGGGSPTEDGKPDRLHRYYLMDLLPGDDQ